MSRLWPYRADWWFRGHGHANPLAARVGGRRPLVLFGCARRRRRSCAGGLGRLARLGPARPRTPALPLPSRQRRQGSRRLRVRLAGAPCHRGRCRRGQVRAALDTLWQRAVGAVAGERRALAARRRTRWAAGVLGAARRPAGAAARAWRTPRQRALCLAETSAETRYFRRSGLGGARGGRRSRGAAEARRWLVVRRRRCRVAHRGHILGEGLPAVGRRRADAPRHHPRHRCLRQRARRSAASGAAARFRPTIPVEQSASPVGERRAAAASPARLLGGLHRCASGRRCRRGDRAATGTEHAGDGGLGLRLAPAPAHRRAGGAESSRSVDRRCAVVRHSDLSAGAWRHAGDRGAQPRHRRHRKRALLGTRPVAGLRPARVHVSGSHRRHDAHRLALGDGAALRPARRQGRRPIDARHARSGGRGRKRGRRRHRGSAAQCGCPRAWPRCRRRNARRRLGRQHGGGDDAAPAPRQQAAGGNRRGRCAEQLDGALASARFLRRARCGDGDRTAVRASGRRGRVVGARARLARIRCAGVDLAQPARRHGAGAGRARGLAAPLDAPLSAGLVRAVAALPRAVPDLADTHGGLSAVGAVVLSQRRDVRPVRDARRHRAAPGRWRLRPQGRLPPAFATAPSGRAVRAWRRRGGFGGSGGCVGLGRRRLRPDVPKRRRRERRGRRDGRHRLVHQARRTLRHGCADADWPRPAGMGVGAARVVLARPRGRDARDAPGCRTALADECAARARRDCAGSAGRVLRLRSAGAHVALADVEARRNEHCCSGPRNRGFGASPASAGRDAVATAPRRTEGTPARAAVLRPPLRGGRPCRRGSGRGRPADRAARSCLRGSRGAAARRSGRLAASGSDDRRGAAAHRTPRRHALDALGARPAHGGAAWAVAERRDCGDPVPREPAHHCRCVRTLACRRHRRGCSFHRFALLDAAANRGGARRPQRRCIRHGQPFRAVRAHPPLGGSEAAGLARVHPRPPGGAAAGCD